MKKPEPEQAKVLAAVDAHFASLATPPQPKSIDAVLLRQAFEKIAIDPYTIFLVHFTSDLDKPEPAANASALDAAQFAQMMLDRAEEEEQRLLLQIIRAVHARL